MAATPTLADMDLIDLVLGLPPPTFERRAWRQAYDNLIAAVRVNGPRSVEATLKAALVKGNATTFYATLAIVADPSVAGIIRSAPIGDPSLARCVSMARQQFFAVRAADKMVVMDTERAAELLGCSVQHVRRMARLGKVAGRLGPDGRWWIEDESVYSLVRKKDGESE